MVGVHDFFMSLVSSLAAAYRDYVIPSVESWSKWIGDNWPPGLLYCGNQRSLEFYRDGQRQWTANEHADLVVDVSPRKAFGPPAAVKRILSPAHNLCSARPVRGKIYGLRIKVEREAVETVSFPIELTTAYRDEEIPGNLLLDRAHTAYLLRRHYRYVLRPEAKFTATFLSGDDVTNPIQISDENGILLQRA